MDVKLNLENDNNCENSYGINSLLNDLTTNNNNKENGNAAASLDEAKYGM